MAKEKFKLQKVLDFRELKEQQLQVEVAEIRSNLEREKINLKKKRSNLLKYKKILDKFQKKPASSQEYKTYLEYIDYLIRDIKIQGEVIQELHNSLVSSMEKLKKACQDKQILEKLKTREIQKAKADEEKTEQNFLDEIGLKINGKNKKEGK
ncbi:MAG: flagellar export protein FliJ [Candidatus Schekmanbacteria bacterium]|nr:MAG: flagellar export protein FliJ [Candidatus Schekmanbacteria bacterium]